MISTKKQRAIYIVLLILWMAVIFIMSSHPADKSSQLSGGIVAKFVKLIYPGFSEFSAEKQSEIMHLTSFLVRKTAHFLEYFVLGMLSALLVATYKEYACKTRVFIAAFFCVLYAIGDEIHQYFVPGRSCELRDVLIDFCGILFGMLILFIIKKIKYGFNKV